MAKIAREKVVGTGKPPDRGAGKAHTDEEHRRMNRMNRDDLVLPSKKERADIDARARRRR